MIRRELPGGVKRIFLLLVASQTLHAIEEYRGELWEVFAPARFLSGLVSDDLVGGFVVINATFVLFGVWCYLGPVSRSWAAAVPLLWFWTLLELGNGGFHVAFAVRAGGYFPGLYTAPLLLLFGVSLAVRLKGPERGGGQ